LNWKTDRDDDTNVNSNKTNSGTLVEGLLNQELYNTISDKLNSSCNGSYGCSVGPSTQLVIWHDGQDGDIAPDIQTSYVHVRVPSPQYELWKSTCSNRLGTPRRMLIWNEIYANGNGQPNRSHPCWIAANVYLGQSERIGFTTGVHLHYEAYVDDEGNSQGDGVFERESAINGSGDVIHPSLAIDVHMEPCEPLSEC